MGKLQDNGKAELIERSGLTQRRVDQLIEVGVFVAGGDEVFDVERNLERYRAYRGQDTEFIVRELEAAGHALSAGLNLLRAEKSLRRRRKLEEKNRVGAQIGRLDAAYRLGNAIAPEGQRELLNAFAGREIGDAVSAYLDLLGMAYVGDGKIAPAKRRA